ncbi:hypothetical protein CYMTET_38995 [Cymbomonas tetramitiformis]|uniref:Uncharacterized protein n=2 Tax=Cymbomonas tetramitiformis TaxID=36881 RepID=A0AAE0CAY0_9CHLO|nr:hypothetical protein CYMTET_38995 [Cymbomonas tetramitiformis]
MSLPDPRKIVQVLMDNATRGSWPIIEDACPWVAAGPCEPHVSSLEVKDMLALPFFKELTKKVHCVRKFILHHQTPLAVFREVSDGMLTTPAGTRMGTMFYAFESFLKHLDAITQTLVSLKVVQYVRGNSSQKATPDSQALGDQYKEAKEFATDPFLASALEFALCVLRPVILLLRLSDSDKATASKIQYAKYEVQENLKSIQPDPENMPWSDGEYDWSTMQQEIISIHRYRWDYGYTIVQGTGYLLDPEFVDMDQHQDAETMASFRAFTAKTFYVDQLVENPTPEQKAAHEQLVAESLRKQAAAAASLLDYKLKRGTWAVPAIWEGAKTMAAADFWFLNGSGDKELQLVAMRSTGQVSGMGSSERAHKVMNFVETKLRNRMLWSNVEAWTYIQHNSHQVDKREKLGHEALNIAWSEGVEENSEWEDAWHPEEEGEMVKTARIASSAARAQCIGSAADRRIIPTRSAVREGRLTAPDRLEI